MADDQRDTVRDRMLNLLIAVIGFVVLGVCGLVVRDGEVGGPERRVFRAFNNDLPEWLYRALWPFQQFGNLIVALVLVLVVALIYRNWRLAVAGVAAVVLKLALEDLVKAVVERSRPGTTIGDIQSRGDVPLAGLSFVSGHAVITAAIAGLVAPVLPARWRWVPWVLVALNGVARIYVGAHNPLDIVGGIGAGLLIAGVLNAVLLPGRRRGDDRGASASRLAASGQGEDAR